MKNSWFAIIQFLVASAKDFSRNDIIRLYTPGILYYFCVYNIIFTLNSHRLICQAHFVILRVWETNLSNNSLSKFKYLFYQNHSQVCKCARFHVTVLSNVTLRCTGGMIWDYPLISRADNNTTCKCLINTAWPPILSIS